MGSIPHASQSVYDIQRKVWFMYNLCMNCTLLDHESLDRVSWTSTTLLRWLTFLIRSLPVTVTVLLFWIYFYFLMLVFVVQWLFLHWKILIMLLSQFPLTFCQTQNKMTCSYCSLWLFFCWLGWSLWSFERCSMGRYLWAWYSAAASEFWQWVQVGIDVYILHHKYPVKPHLSPWFSASCASVIVHRNHFFCTNRINLLNFWI